MEIVGKIDGNPFSHPRSQGPLVFKYGRKRPGDKVAIFQMMSHPPYLGKIFWEGHTTDIGPQGFHAQLKFLARKFKMARCSGI